MAIFFFDTCALVPRYHPGNHTYRVQKVFGGRGARVYISELTVVELASSLASICRARKLPASDYDAMLAAFEADLASERIRVVGLSSDDFWRAGHLIRFAGVERGRNLGSGDAIIAVCCRQFAIQSNQRVRFYTKDWTLYSTIYQIDAYTSILKLRFLGKGKGGIPPSCG